MRSAIASGNPHVASIINSAFIEGERDHSGRPRATRGKSGSKEVLVKGHPCHPLFFSILVFDFPWREGECLGQSDLSKLPDQMAELDISWLEWLAG